MCLNSLGPFSHLYLLYPFKITWLQASRVIYFHPLISLICHYFIFWSLWLGSHIQTLWDAEDFRHLVPGPSACTTPSFYRLSCLCHRCYSRWENWAGKEQELTRVERPSVAHWFCCPSTEGNWVGVGGGGVYCGFPNDNYGKSQHTWGIVALVEDLGFVPCSFYKRGKASAKDVALSLGSYFRSHCTVTRLEGMKGGRLMWSDPPICIAHPQQGVLNIT